MTASRKKSSKDLPEETRYSFSLTNLNCHRRILKTINKERPEVLPSEETDIGRRVHYLLSQILRKPVDLRDFSELHNIIKIYGETEELFKEYPEITTEQKLVIELNDKKFVTITDFLVIDEEKKEVIILDHKSGFNKDILPQYREQLEFYALPFLIDGYKVRIGIHFVRYSRIDFIDVLEGLGDYTRIMEILMAKIEKIESVIKEKDDKTISTAAECKYCPFIVSCPVTSSIAIKSPKQAAELANEYLKLKFKIKKIEEVLKIWCQHTGFIYIKGGKIGYAPSQSLNIDEKGLYEYIKNSKIPFLDVFSVNVSKFKKISKLDDNLTAYGAIETGPRWTVKTSREKEDYEDEQRFLISETDSEKEEREEAIKEIEKVQQKAKEAVERFVEKSGLKKED